MVAEPLAPLQRDAHIPTHWQATRGGIMEFKIKCKLCGESHHGTLCPHPKKASAMKERVEAIQSAPVTKGKGKPAKKAKGKK